MKFLQQLARQDMALTRDQRLLGEWVARGKNPIGIAASVGVVGPLSKAGAPISWIRLGEGGLLHPAGSVLGLAGRAPHPNAAKVMANWLLTAEGQRLYSVGFGQPAKRLGVSTEGLDSFAIPRPDDKYLVADEEFGLEVESRGREIGRSVFAPLLQSP